METKTKKKAENKPECLKYCSSYESDCCEVENPTACFLGGFRRCEGGMEHYFHMADGICKEAEIRKTANKV